MAKGDVLQQKEKRFCLELVKNGGNRTQAYKDAGYAVKNDNVAGVEGHNLLEKPKIRAEYDRLCEKVTTPVVLTITQRMELLSKIGADENCSANERINAIDKLNKMDGVYVQKQEITTAVPVVLVDDVCE